MDIVASLQRRADIIADHHSRKAGRTIERPFSMEDLAIAEITRLRSLTAEMRAALERIERGEIDEGGCRRECVDAGAIARSALSRSQGTSNE